MYRIMDLDEDNFWSYIQNYNLNLFHIYFVFYFYKL